MITPTYVRKMARYNIWQNSQISGFLDVMDEAEVTRDRGAFFGSILGTLNHILWGDGMWMSRWYDPVEKPAQPITDTTGMTADLAAWRTARMEMDQHIDNWAQGLDETRLVGDLTWYSGATGQEQSMPLALCITHFFNHQTHHRGQVHAMLTAAGSKAPVSDLVFMPEDAGWP